MSRSPNPARGIGQDIRAARLNAGLTQRQLADQAGVSRPTVARVETGSNVSTGTLLKLTEAMSLKIKIEN